jgi:SAM-dependent methyltransferase
MDKPKCVICFSPEVMRYFEVRNSPFFQNVLSDDKLSANGVPLVNCEFWLCSNCLCLFNPKFVEEKYSTEYNNDQSMSKAYRQHLDQVVAFFSGTLEKHSPVLEIGCGNGLVLRMLRDLGHVGVEGYDPAHAAGLPYIKREYWRPSGKRYDAIILRHVLEANLSYESLLLSAAQELAPNGFVYLEFTNSRTIVQRSATLTLYHEYPQYFSEIALSIVLGRIGMYIHDIKHFFDGEITGVIARRVMLRMPSAMSFEKLKMFDDVCIWGIGGRSINFLTNYANELRNVRFAVDLDPRKQGKYVPFSGQPIVSPEECLLNKPQAVIVLNNHYVNEVSAFFSYPVVILTLEDFADKDDRRRLLLPSASR